MYTLNRVIEWCPDDTSPIVMEVFVNDEPDDKKNKIEENETKLHDEEKYYTEVNDEEGY